MYQILLIEVPHCRAIPGLGGDIHKGSVGLLYKHPVGKPIQVYIPRDAGDPPVVRILKPNPAAPVTNGRRLTGPVVCNPQGVAGEFCLPDGGCTVSVGIEHRRDTGAGLQRFRKGQCNGVQLRLGEVAILLKVYRWAAVIRDFPDQFGKIGCLLTCLGGIRRCHIEIEPCFHARLAGVGSVFAETCVFRVSIPCPNIHDLFS